MLKNFLKPSPDCPYHHWLTFTLGITKKCCTRIAGTRSPYSLRKECISRPDWYRELPIQNQHLSEYLGKYQMLTSYQLRKYSSTMSEWWTQRFGTEQGWWKGCLEFDGLVWNLSTTLKTYLLMWRELEPPCPERSLNGAGTENKQ